MNAIAHSILLLATTALLRARLLRALGCVALVVFIHHAAADTPPVTPNARYWGTSTNPGPLTNAQILALSNDRATTADTAIITNNGGDVSRYVYYAYPARFGDLHAAFILYNSGFNQLDGFTKSTQTVSPVGGPAELYNVYRSNNTLSGGYPLGFFTNAPPRFSTRYWGTTPNAGPLSNAQMLALSNDMATNANSNVGISIPGLSGQYVYFAYPARYGELTAVYPNGGNDALSTFAKSTQTVSPSGGTAETYNVYRSNTLFVGTHTFTFVALLSPPTSGARYWGPSASSTLNNAQILRLISDNGLNANKTATISPSSEYVYYGYPARFGDLTAIWRNGTTTLKELGNFIKMQQTVDPVSGANEPYNVYRSTLRQTGSNQWGFFASNSLPSIASRYWGTTHSPGPLTNAEILSLSADADTNANKAIVTSNDSEAKYVYYAYPARFGELTDAYFYGLSQLGGFTRSTQTISPAGGPAELYNVYRSNNELNGGAPIDFVALPSLLPTARYWGGTASPGPLSNAEVDALSSDTATNGNNAFAITLANEYLYYCYPRKFGSLSAIYINGNTTVNSVTAFAVSPQSVIPVGGTAEAYYVYRTIGRLTGTIQFQFVRNFGPDTDGDGILDAFETGTGVYVSPQNTGTGPANPDSDGDGICDNDELQRRFSNPNIGDSDGDGFDDGFEVATSYNPTVASSTPEGGAVLLKEFGVADSAEYRFNAANGVSYRIEASTNLVNWTTIEANIVGIGSVVTRFYSTGGQPRRFFRSRRN